MNPNSFVEQLNKIVIPIRKQYLGRKFTTDCQKNYLRKDLLSLISMLNDGTEHRSKLSKGTLIYAQLIVLNYKPNSTGAVDKTISFSEKRSTFNLIQCPQFEWTVSLWIYYYRSVPYGQVFLFFTWEFLKITKDLKCFLPRGTQKGLVTVIAKDNTNLNTRSSTADTNTFWRIRWYSLYDCIYTVNNTIYPLEINSLPEEYSEISNFLPDLAVYFASKGKNAPHTIQEVLKRTIQLSYFFYLQKYLC